MNYLLKSGLNALFSLRPEVPATDQAKSCRFCSGFGN